MEVKNIILLVLWLGIILVSIGACYKVYVMDRNYSVLSLVECDPTVTSCFALLCDEESENYSEDLCNQIDAGEKRHFSLMRKQAKNIESCDARSKECPDLTCAEREEGCEIITCTDRILVAYGDENMSCTPEVIVPVEDKKEEVPMVKPQEQEVTPSLPGKESNLPIPVPTDTPEELIPAPVITQPESEPTPAAEDLPEPTHNLPI
jgi:hypothetical protein